ncbi:unnamed protein product [Mytilus coruscus]|uniref:Uncharacterized protein n=1 Tax=Mytilus coruscus TaxID=42192 RepID=A0A6J8D1G8_MYTCO|nr:unnamed protein product [Mytilus coruscus]
MMSHLEMHSVCIIPNSTNLDNVDAVYSMSHSSLPIFRFETEFRTKIIQNADTESSEYHCLTKGTGDTLTSNDCTSDKSFHCTDDKGNESCVAVLNDDISCSLTYQFRPCSDHLPVLCRDKNNPSHISTPYFVNRGSHFPADSTESTFIELCKPTSTKISDVQRPGENNETFGKVVLVNVVLFLLCIISVIMFIFRNRFHKPVGVTSKQIFPNNIVNRNTMIQTGIHSERNNRVSPNEQIVVRASSNEPLELRHNNFHIGELEFQEIVNVTIGETEI